MNLETDKQSIIYCSWSCLCEMGWKNFQNVLLSSLAPKLQWCLINKMITYPHFEVRLLAATDSHCSSLNKVLQTQVVNSSSSENNVCTSFKNFLNTFL